MATIYFTKGFDKYACDGDRITCKHKGFTLTATVYPDDDCLPPWERDCCHGPVSKWTSRAKGPGERILNEDHGSKRYYDFAAAVTWALKDGWGVEGGRLKGESKKAYAARAAEHDFDVLKAWCDDEGHYVGVAVVVSKNGIELTGKYDNALWGIECNYPGSDNSYLTEVANELAGEAMDMAKEALKALCGVVP